MNENNYGIVSNDVFELHGFSHLTKRISIYFSHNKIIIKAIDTPDEIERENEYIVYANAVTKNKEQIFNIDNELLIQRLHELHYTKMHFMYIEETNSYIEI